MKSSANCYKLIKHYEGCELNAYLCPSDKLTIGYGHINDVTKGEIITQEQADNFFLQDIINFETIVNNLVKVKLSQNQFDALVSFVFNVGRGSFETSTLLNLLNKGDYNDIPAQLLRWDKDSKGSILDGLEKRRKSESILWTTGNLSLF